MKTIGRLIPREKHRYSPVVSGCPGDGPRRVGVHARHNAQRLIQDLVDIVSKNGCLLLNIAPRADGSIPREQIDRLLAMGDWLRVNGEAIYGTRPWKTFGEGPAIIPAGYLADLKFRSFCAKGIRFLGCPMRAPCAHVSKRTTGARPKEGVLPCGLRASDWESMAWECLTRRGATMPARRVARTR